MAALHIFLYACLLLPLSNTLPQRSKIEDLELLHKLQNGQKANVFIKFVESSKKVAEKVSNDNKEKKLNRAEFLTSLYENLERSSQTSQQSVVSFLETLSEKYQTKRFWISNLLLIKNANYEVIAEIQSFPEVETVFEDFDMLIDDPQPTKPIIKKNDSTPLWNVQKLHAMEANVLVEILSLNPGRIGIIDTGARHTHEAIRHNFDPEFGWFDPYDFEETPYDTEGHGTHIIGTICGSKGIGIYPGANWLACRGCYSMRCAFSGIIACMEFMTCPTSPDGKVRDCSKAPFVVSNSYGGLRGMYFYDDAIAVWHVAHIIPVYSIGNSGPKCDTANSPGDRDVIGVGSTTIENKISGFSSKGPALEDRRIKPDVVAPGSAILSAYHTADDDYRELSGTSMACPHVAATVTMMKAIKPHLNYLEVYKGLSRYGVSTNLTWEEDDEYSTCHEIPAGTFPNHIFGYGMVNSFTSVTSIILES